MEDDEKLREALESLKKGKSKELNLLSRIMKNIEGCKMAYEKLGKESEAVYSHFEESYYEHSDHLEITAEVVGELEVKLKSTTDEATHLRKALEAAKKSMDLIDIACMRYSDQIQAALDVPFHG